MTDYERALMSLDEAGLNQLFEKAMAAKPAAFSGARQPERSTMGIATPQDVQFAEQAKEKVAPIAQAVYEGTLADPVERLASWSALADPNTPEAARKAAQDYVAPLPVTPEGRINEEGLSRAAGPMMGVTTYHGSPTSGIRKWDLNFRGTGEGGLHIDSPYRESFTDMIGHGLYSAENEGIARGYRDRLSQKSRGISASKAWHEFANNFPQEAGQFAEELEFAADRRLKIPDFENELQNVHFYAENGHPQLVSPDIAKFILSNTSKVKEPAKGSLYTTELTPHPDEFLLWDKPLSEQSEKVREALKSHLLKRAEQNAKSLGKPKTYAKELVEKMLYQNDGASVYRSLVQSEKTDRAASEYLNSLGIRGVKYLDNPSRGAGEGTYNYVTFNPAEEAIITHENGQRIPGAVEEAYRKLRDPKSKAIFEKRYPELKGE